MATEVILVTGASGMVGHALAAALAMQGRPVIGVDRRPSARSTAGFSMLQAELGDFQRLCDLVREHRVHAIVHCGGISGPMLGRDDPAGVSRANIMGTVHILEAARILGLERVVYCSSCGAYGDTGPPPVGEDAPLAATDIYGATKAAGDMLVRAYAARHDVNGIAIRLCWIYGPGRTTSCVIRTMVQDALMERPTRLPFGRGVQRQFIYLDDAVEALIAALDAVSISGCALNVTGGVRTTLDEVAATVRDVLPRADIQLASGPDPDDYWQELFDISAARRDLGWRPRVELREGIGRYVTWLARPHWGVA